MPVSKSLASWPATKSQPPALLAGLYGASGLGMSPGQIACRVPELSTVDMAFSSRRATNDSASRAREGKGFGLARVRENNPADGGGIYVDARWLRCPRCG